MSDLTGRLAEALAACDAATEGPWSVTEMGGLPDIRTDHDGNHDLNDAAFIAASRTGYPAALKALQAVLELHTPILDYNKRSFPDGVCAECIKDAETEGTIAWPCATVLAIIEHLGER